MALVSRATGFLSALLPLHDHRVGGSGSGATNVPVMGLVAAWFRAAGGGRAAGFLVIGSGFAIMLSGRLIPFLNRWNRPRGVANQLAPPRRPRDADRVRRLRPASRRPEEKGLAPVGADETAVPVDTGPGGAEVNIYRRGIIYYLGAIYFLFGYTYVIYATFIVTTAGPGAGVLGEPGGNFWMVVGFLSLFSVRLRYAVGPDRPEGGLDDRLFPAAVSYLLIATKLPGIFCYLSIGFYGIVAWSIPSIMAAAIGDYVGRKRPRRRSASSRSSSGWADLGSRRRRGAGGTDGILLRLLLHGRGVRRHRDRPERVSEEAATGIGIHPSYRMRGRNPE